VGHDGLVESDESLLVRLQVDPSVLGEHLEQVAPDLVSDVRAMSPSLEAAEPGASVVGEPREHQCLGLVSGNRKARDASLLDRSADESELAPERDVGRFWSVDEQRAGVGLVERRNDRLEQVSQQNGVVGETAVVAVHEVRVGSHCGPSV